MIAKNEIAITWEINLETHLKSSPNSEKIRLIYNKSVELSQKYEFEKKNKRSSNKTYIGTSI